MRLFNSLWLRLTLAFLFIGVTGAVLVVLIVGSRTRTEFDRFVSAREQEFVAALLVDHYDERNSWRDVERLFGRHRGGRGDFGDSLAVLDENGRLVYENRWPENRPFDAAQQIPLLLEDERIGTLLVERSSAERFDPPSATDFLANVGQASFVSAGVAMVLSLLLGSLLARTLTKPIRELTAATQKMADGELGQQVTVRRRDEIGRLASSFNQMSSDLAESTQQRRQMTADIAHDLRTPLSILLGYTEGLKDGRLSGNPNLYTTMYDEAKHLQHLIEDLRTLSLADAGELSLNARAVDPRALLERTALAHLPLAEEKGIALTIEAAEKLPSIDVDTERMAQVLNNLVTNALRFTGENGRVVLGASATGGRVLLTVQDTGSGIGPDDLPHIFDRFYRADKSRQRSGGNTSGLGLAISKAIVAAHGGEITAVSQVGKGTTFKIDLQASTGLIT